MYKKILLVSAFALGLSSAAFAAVTTTTDAPADTTATSDITYNPSIYFGGQGLLTNMHYSNSAYTLPRNSVSSTKGGGRGYLGYAFNQFLALEAGYDYFGRPKLEDKVTGNTQDFTQQGIDLTGKATLPLDYGFGVYIKAGGIWVWRSGVGTRGGCFVDKDPNGKVTAFGGLGVSYNFVQNMGIDLSYARSFSVGDMPKMDIFALGLSYKINM